ncbi:MAG: hypothetical protein JJ920_02050 [Roseitalea sp.]|nr:hypothetical protein [Roseitalea sp.]MBO6741663.1 hypothetical protein [Roseitalea sp.]
MLGKHRDEIELKNYAYVSLFGLNSLAQLRSQLFLNTVETRHIGKDFSLEDVEASLKASKSWLKRIGVLAYRIYAGTDDAESALSLIALSARNQIICFDDLERSGKDLEVEAVFGYATQLKEERNCKVVFLLNEEVLDRDDRVGFDTHLEKVVDVNLRFAPTPQESLDIALTGADQASQLTREHCLKLGIDNVRVISKIHRAVVQLQAELQPFPKGVFENVVASVVLFGWMQHQPNMAPTMEFLRSYVRIAFDDKKDEQTEQEAAWKKLLDDYPFNHIDAFDSEIVKALESGYFSPETVTAHADELNKRLASTAAMNEWQAAWETWRYSFQSSANTVTRAIADAFIKNTAHHTSDHLNTLYALCIRMGETATAKQALDHFLAFNKNNVEAFDIDKSFYHGDDFHPDVKGALTDAYAALRPAATFDQLLVSLTNMHNSEIIEALDQYEASDFENAFLNFEGEELRTRIEGVHRLRRIGNPSPEINSVVGKVTDALIRIATTSPINKERVEKTWGVELPPEFEPAAAAPKTTKRQRPKQKKPK